MRNPPGGCMIDTIITAGDNDFYLISQKTNRGTSLPTHYHIVVNDLCDRGLASPQDLRKQVADLSYKMCYLYYNTVGAIKVPAPIHYAHRLSNFIGDNSSHSEKMIPHQHLGRIKSLYFI